MNLHLHAVVLGLLVFICSPALIANPWKSELERNTDYIQSLAENPDVDLNKILRGITGIEVNIYFRTNSTELDFRSREQIASIAKVMWVYPIASVSLGGHTDSRGSSVYNRKLAQKRIDAVQNLLRDLLSNKYHPRRINTYAYGESFSPHNQDDREGMAFDRRVSILLIVPVRKH